MLAMALNSIGVEAKSLTGRQVGIKTDSAFTKARIESIDTDVMTENLDAGRVIVVAGFQGFDAARQYHNFRPWWFRYFRCCTCCCIKSR